MKRTILMIGLFLIFCVVFHESCKTSKNTVNECGAVPVSYNSKMKSIIQEKCAGCHQTGKKAGKKAVFASFAEMEPHLGDMFREAIELKEMPPEKAPQLTAEEVQAWKCWQKNKYQE